MAELTLRTIRKRPVEVHAVRADAENLPLIVNWIKGEGHHAVLGNGQLIIQTLEGPFTVRPGDEVIGGCTGSSTGTSPVSCSPRRTRRSPARPSRSPGTSPTRPPR